MLECLNKLIKMNSSSSFLFGDADHAVHYLNCASRRTPLSASGLEIELWSGSREKRRNDWVRVSSVKLVSTWRFAHYAARRHPWLAKINCDAGASASHSITGAPEDPRNCKLFHAARDIVPEARNKRRWDLINGGYFWSRRWKVQSAGRMIIGPHSRVVGSS